MPEVKPGWSAIEGYGRGGPAVANDRPMPPVGLRWLEAPDVEKKPVLGQRGDITCLIWNNAPALVAWPGNHSE